MLGIRSAMDRIDKKYDTPGRKKKVHKYHAEETLNEKKKKHKGKGKQGLTPIGGALGYGNMQEFDIGMAHEITHHLSNHAPTLATFGAGVLAARGVEAAAEHAAHKIKHHVAKIFHHLSRKKAATQQQSHIDIIAGRTKKPGEKLPKGHVSPAKPYRSVQEDNIQELYGKGKLIDIGVHHLLRSHSRFNTPWSKTQHKKSFHRATTMAAKDSVNTAIKKIKAEG
jgi:hypothetical protein